MVNSKKKSILIVSFLIAITLTIIIRLFDTQIIRFIAGLRGGLLDYIFLSVIFASNAMIILFFLTTIFLWQEHKRRWIFPLWIVSFCSILVSYLLKIWIMRPRPFQDGAVSVLAIAFNFIKDNFSTWNTSFPSFEAMLVFSVFPLLNKEFKKFRYVWLIFACLVALSRVYFGVHYFSDIMAGAIIGYLIGMTALVLEEKYMLGKLLIKKFKLD